MSCSCRSACAPRPESTRGLSILGARPPASAPAASLEALQLLRVADRVDARDATLADHERQRRAMAVAARDDKPKPAVELDLDRFAHRPAAERHPCARDSLPAVQRMTQGGHASAAVRCPDDIWVEHCDEGIEVALVDGLRERAHGAIVLVA